MSASEQLSRQLAELRILYDIGRSLSATLDLDELLTRIVEAAVSITRAEEGVLLLPDPHNGTLTIRAAKNLDDRLVHSLRLPTSDSLAGRVLQTKTPLLVNNDKGWEKIKTKYLVKSLIYVPLLTKGQAIGVLGVDNKEKPTPFTPHDQERLRTLASYAAIAIENAQLYEEAILRTRELSLLVDTASAAASSLELSQVLETISRQIIRGLDVSWCRISRWEPENGRLRVLNEYREAIWGRSGGPTRDLNAYPQTLRLLRQSQPFALYPTNSDRPAFSRSPYRAALAVPLKLGGQIVGVAEIFRARESTHFSPQAISISQHAAQEVAPLLLRRVVGAGWHQAIADGSKVLLAAAGADWCALSLWERDANVVRQATEYGGATWPNRSGQSLSLHKHSAYHTALEQQKTRIIQLSDPNLTEHDRAALHRWDAPAILLVPLTIKGKTIGLLELADVRPERTISKREINLARALADQAAMSIENARLFSDLEHSLAALNRAQSQLVQAARLSALGELAAMVAHQINNPLTTILADAEMLTQDLPPGHSGRQSAEAIFRAGQRAKTVVDRLLNMARPAAHTRPLDVNTTIQTALELVCSQLEVGGIKLETHLTPNLPPVDALPGQLEDVWLNLLLNARDALHGSQPGTISISSTLAKEGTAIEVSVWDSGSGIPQEHMQRLFDPFFTTKPRGMGTGLGLYICKQTISQHKGQITISSQPGKGTRVRVRLPLAARPPGQGD